MLGQKVTYRITADVEESEPSTYAVSINSNPSAVSVGPDNFASSNYGEFTIEGLAVGTSTLTLEWAYAPNNAMNFCGVTVNVVAPASAPPPTTANNENSGFSGDPVNVYNGEFTMREEPDIDLGGPLPLTFSRYYASGLERDSLVHTAMGRNWMHNYDIRLLLDTGKVTVLYKRGRVIEFIDNSSIWELQGNGEIPFQLVSENDGYVLLDPRNNRFYTFNADGQLTTIDDGKGNALTLTYQNLLLHQVSDGLGRTLTFEYEGFQLLYGVTDGTRTVSFNYDYWPNLTSVTDTRTNTTYYTYDNSNGTGALLTGKQEPVGNTPYTETYDSSGRVISQSDADNNTWTFTYNADATVITNPELNTREFVHDTGGNLLRITNEVENVSSFGYSSEGRRNSVTASTGSQMGTTFHAGSGGPATITNPDNSSTSVEYGSRAVRGLTVYDVSRIVYQGGAAELFEYDANGNLTKWTDRSGQEWNYTYNSRGQVLTRTAPSGAVETYTYNAAGLIETSKDGLNNTTTFEYDTLGRLKKAIHPDTSERVYAYDASDNIISVTDENGAVTEFEYDLNGNVQLLRDPLLNETTYAYDDNNRLTGTTDPLSHSTSRTYDSMGRLASVTDRNNQTTTYEYDDLGKLKKVTDPAAKEWGYTYDSEGILESVSNPDSDSYTFDADAFGRIVSQSGSTTQGTVNYNSLGQLTKITDPEGHVTSYEYDGLGRVTKFKLPGNITAEYTRNNLGRISEIVDPRGSLWQYGYNTVGKVTSLTDPLTRTTSYAYDSRQRISDITFPSGLGSVTFTHDGLGQVTRKLFSDGTDLNYTFDANGNLKTANGLSLSYDANDRIIGSNGLTMTRDAGERLETITYASGKTVTYAYNSRDQIATITDWIGGVVTFNYDDVGRLTSVTRPNGVTTTYSQNEWGQVTGISHGTFASITLQRDGNGKLIRAERTVPLEFPSSMTTVSHTFDNASQLVGANYDAMGRRLQDDTRTYTWNLASLLTSATWDSTTVTYTYDASGQRISRTKDSVTRGYVWNYAIGLHSVAIERENSTDLRYYIYTPQGELISRIEANGDRYFYHFDETGSTLALTDNSGTVVESYAYSPYGEIVNQPGSLENTFTYHGKYGVMQEEDSGLYYMRARYYDSTTRQFISKDPVRSLHPRGMNPYQFAYGDPLRFNDPLGLDVLVPNDVFGMYDPLNPKQPVMGWQLNPGRLDLPQQSTLSSKGFTPISLGTYQGPGVLDYVDPIAQSKVFGIGTTLLAEVLERGFKNQGQRIIQAGLKNGNFAGAATAGTRAAITKGIGAGFSGALGAYNEARQAAKEGQGTGAIVARSTGAFVVDATISVASTPIAVVDTATGGNFSSAIKQNVRIATALAGDNRAQRQYANAAGSGQYGPVVQVTHQAGEAWAERGFGGTFYALGVAYGIIDP